MRGRRRQEVWTADTVAYDGQLWPSEQAAAWQSAFDPNSEERPGFCRVTQYTIARTYTRFLAFCAEFEIDPDIAPASAKAFAEYLEKKGLKLVSIASQLHDLRKVASVIFPWEDMLWLYRAAELIAKAGEGQPKRKIRVLRSVTPEHIFRRSTEIMDILRELDLHTILWKDAQMYRDAFFIALGMLIPERRRVLAAISVSDISGGGTIVFDASSMKTRRTSIREIPPSFQKYVDEWLKIRKKYSPDHHGLWISKGGGHISSSGLYASMRTFTLKEFGVALSPHRLRDLAATFCVESLADLGQSTRHVLGHKYSDITDNYTETAKQIEASRRLAKAIDNVAVDYGRTFTSGIRPGNRSSSGTKDSEELLRTHSSLTAVEAP